MPQHNPPDPSVTKDSALAWALSDAKLSIARDAAFAHALAQSEAGHAESPRGVARSSDGAGPSSRPTFAASSKTFRAVSKVDTRQILPDVAVPPFTCGICFELTPVALRIPPAECGHAFCVTCMRKHLIVLATERMSYPFPCPACVGNRKRPALLEPETCLKAHAGTGEAYRAMERLLLERQHSNRLCYCANKDCSAAFDFQSVTGYSGEQGAPKATCPMCGTDTCVDCNVRWHEGRDCTRFRDEKNGDGLLLRLAESKRWKKCPKCQAVIEKSHGCNSMTCRCGYTFCYGCGSSPCRCGRV